MTEIMSQTRSPAELAQQLEVGVREITKLANELNDLRKHTRVSTLAAAYEQDGQRPVLAENIAESFDRNLAGVVEALNDVGNRLHILYFQVEGLSARVKTWPEARR